MRIAVLLLALLVSGCATSFVGLCGVQPLGQTDTGVVVASVRCEAQ